MRIHKHKYRRHKATGRAFVELGGRRIYLGAYGSPESRQLYDQTLAEWTLAGRPVAASGSADPVSQVGQDGITVVELVDRYMDHVETYYRKPDGTPTQEQDNIARALGPLTDLYGLSPGGILRSPGPSGGTPGNDPPGSGRRVPTPRLVPNEYQ